MEEEIIIEILKNKELLIDFLEYNNVEKIINKILEDEDLFSQLKEIPKSFWLEVLKKGLLVYKDYTAVTRNNRDECINYKYQQFYNSKEKIPALIYQKRKKYFKKFD